MDIRQIIKNKKQFPNFNKDFKFVFKNNLIAFKDIEAYVNRSIVFETDNDIDDLDICIKGLFSTLSNIRFADETETFEGFDTEYILETVYKNRTYGNDKKTDLLDVTQYHT